MSFTLACVQKWMCFCCVPTGPQVCGVFSCPPFCRTIDWILGLATPHMGIKVGQEAVTDDSALLVKMPENFSPGFPRQHSHYGIECLMAEDQGPEPWNWAIRTSGAGGTEHCGKHW